MKITGARTIRAHPEDIWDFLMTPDRLRTCLPGVEAFVASSPETFEATLRLGIGFLKGTYKGTLRVAEQRHPEHLRLVVHGGGGLGALDADGTVKLVNAGESTFVLYEGEAHLSGHIAALGEGVINGAVNRLTGVFFDCLASKVEPPA